MCVRNSLRRIAFAKWENLIKSENKWSPCLLILKPEEKYKIYFGQRISVTVAKTTILQQNHRHFLVARRRSIRTENDTQRKIMLALNYFDSHQQKEEGHCGFSECINAIKPYGAQTNKSSLWCPIPHWTVHTVNDTKSTNVKWICRTV